MKLPGRKGTPNEPGEATPVEAFVESWPQHKGIKAIDLNDGKSHHLQTTTTGDPPVTKTYIDGWEQPSNQVQRDD